MALMELHLLQGTEHSVYLDLLRLFAHGMWSDYKSNASHLLRLMPDQILKLKQLTVLTLAETDKIFPYDVLMQELDIATVRELEDFLINECMYVGIVRGKLDQLRRCFEMDELVHKAKLYRTNLHFLYYWKDCIFLYRYIWKILG